MVSLISPTGKQSFNTTKAFQIAFSEFGACIILLYFGSALCHPLSFAIGVIIAVQLFGNISGAHISPAVTIGAIIMNAVELMYVPFYILPQFLGCFVGYVLYILIHFDTNSISSGMCATKVALITPIQGMILELIMTMLLVLVCCSLWDTKNENKPDTACLKFAFILFALAISSKDYTGGSFNSARSLPPALLSNDFEDNWVYWIGPNLGGIIGALFYKLVLFNRPY